MSKSDPLARALKVIEGLEAKLQVAVDENKSLTTRFTAAKDLNTRYLERLDAAGQIKALHESMLDGIYPQWRQPGAWESLMQSLKEEAAAQRTIGPAVEEEPLREPPTQ